MPRFLKNKTVVFSFDENSKQSVGYSGPRAGIERQPDVKSVRAINRRISLGNKMI
jgi:hypothetical protein